MVHRLSRATHMAVVGRPLPLFQRNECQHLKEFEAGEGLALEAKELTDLIILFFILANCDPF
jgi:hypothetical protein